MKIPPVAAQLFHAGGHTDRQTSNLTKLTISFPNFAEALKNVCGVAGNHKFSDARSPS